MSKQLAQALQDAATAAGTTVEAIAPTAQATALTEVLTAHKDDNGTAAAQALAAIEANAIAEASAAHPEYFVTIAAVLTFGPRGTATKLAKDANVSEATVTRWKRIGRIIAAQPRFWHVTDDNGDVTTDDNGKPIPNAERLAALVKGARNMSASDEAEALKATDPLTHVPDRKPEPKKRSASTAKAGKADKRTDSPEGNGAPGVPEENGAPAPVVPKSPAPVVTFDDRVSAAFDLIAALITEAEAITDKRRRNLALKRVKLSAEGLVRSASEALAK